jgi:hypothetical protein
MLETYRAYADTLLEAALRLSERHRAKKYSLRDAGEFLGMSPEGVRKLVGAAKAKDAKPKATTTDGRARGRAR